MTKHIGLPSLCLVVVAFFLLHVTDLAEIVGNASLSEVVGMVE